MSNYEDYLEQLSEIEKDIGMEFKNKEFLFRCLIHDSYVYENEPIRLSNERLEFLGDAVLGLVISHLIFKRFPGWTEGEMALFKSKLVSADSLADKARGINLGRYVFLGKGEAARGGRDRGSILSDCMEAFIGAVYLDQGYDAAYALIEGLFEDFLNVEYPLKDFKSNLQEYSQKYFRRLPVYRLIDEKGPPHEKWFRIRVRIEEGTEGTGEGSSKKEAEQNAARNLLEKLNLMDER